jgi:long-subunit acyl-CoA synthetase (AMP-forming)
MGYLDNEKSTWSCFDSEGFFHTGDSGYLHEKGDVIITGRIKELIITSGG